MSGELRGLPQWVWDLLEALDRWEDEHPKFYRLGDDCEFVSTSCGRDKWMPTVPLEAWDVMEIRREALEAAR